ncbi:MAG: hypothetical protein KatS3mg115_2582 [Candidatus Poribacteria bacterium]|nr:MAG: hypothetical protein KatS3mg115_2582 [Candidatus Poribacteria bacterium]
MERCFLSLLLLAWVGKIAGADPLRDAGLLPVEQFADPPREFRILKIIHGWPDRAEEQDALIETLLRQGFGGVVCNVSFEDYLESAPKWEAFVRAVKRAKKAGMTLWLYDERGYPSGTAGGLVLRDHPEWQARGLLIAEALTHGEKVRLELPPGRLIQAVAVPVESGQLRLERTQGVSSTKSRHLEWSPPREGSWHLFVIAEDVLYEGTHAAVSFGDRLPYIDLLRPEPTARFLEVTHQRYAERLGGNLGRWFRATFTDEPSLMSLFFRPMPYRVLPWSPEFSKVFRERRGYSIEPLLPALVAEAGPQGRRVRYDFWLTVSELVSEHYFGQIQEWCRRHGLASGGHLLMEESLAAHVPLYGDLFRVLRRMDAPGIDCLTSVPAEVPWQIARLAGSAATLDHRRWVMSETSDFVQLYRAEGDRRPVRTVTETEIRGTIGKLVLGGVNVITSYYSFRELSEEQLQRLNLWAGRLGALLDGARLSPSIAVLYPIESLWIHFVPARNGATDSAEAYAIEETFRTASEGLYRSRQDFLYLDTQTLESATVRDGWLHVGDQHWNLLVLPRADTLSEKAWERIVQLWESGGAVIALGALPENSASEYPSSPVQAIGRRLFGNEEGLRPQRSEAGGVGLFLPAGAEALLPAVVEALLEPTLQFSEPAETLRASHRRREGWELTVLFNEDPEPWRGTLTLPATGEGYLWDPATGERRSFFGERPLELSLEGYGMLVIQWKRSKAPGRIRAELGELPQIAYRPMPTPEPMLTAGEHVRGRAEPFRGESGRDGWEANGLLTRGNVDTFLFLSFVYPSPQDLSEAFGIVLESWVPEGQRTPAQLLVILRDADGADYLASTGRPLSQSGWVRTIVSLDRFQLGGWSSDPNGRLDRDRIAALSIGWGGYYGQDGETVRFRVLPPSDRPSSSRALGEGTPHRCRLVPLWSG